MFSTLCEPCTHTVPRLTCLPTPVGGLHTDTRLLLGAARADRKDGQKLTAGRRDEMSAELGNKTCCNSNDGSSATTILYPTEPDSSVTEGVDVADRSCESWQGVGVGGGGMLHSALSRAAGTES